MSKFDAASIDNGSAGPRGESRPLRHSPYPRLLGRALVAAARLAVQRGDRALRRIEEEQERVLQSIVRHSEKTEFGRRHAFDGIRSYESFVRRVPVGDYDSFSPAIERMRQGETNILIPEFVPHFANSSGSSGGGKPKYLPISERQISAQRRAGADTLARYLAHTKDTEFTLGFTLGLFPSTTMRREGPVLITSNPALMVTRMPVLGWPIYLPHDDVRTIADYEKKLVAISERYLDWDVRAVAGTTCWFSLMFETLLETARRRGRRARTVSDLWPNLRLLLGGGVSAEPYVPIIRRLVGRDDVTLVDSYNATEGGLYATSDFSGASGMLMLPHPGTFFEFIALDERDRPMPQRIPLWAVERDRPYVIVVTTPSGLYAYELGDIVRFPSVDPPRIEFMGRLTGCLSVTQELTTHVEIERAVARAIAKCPCRTLDFGAAAEIGTGGTAKSRYVLFVEFDEGAAPTNVDHFTAAFDEGLCIENRVYREHRAGDVAILPPRVAPLIRGGAQRFLDDVTGGNVQGKFPRILDEKRKSKLDPYVRPLPPSS